MERRQARLETFDLLGHPLSERDEAPSMCGWGN